MITFSTHINIVAGWGWALAAVGKELKRNRRTTDRQTKYARADV